MKLTLVIAMILAIVTSLLTPGQTRNKSTNPPGGQSMNSNLEQEILKLEEDYRQAAMRLDAAALDRIYADDLIVTAPNGILCGKAAALGEARQATGKVTIERYEKDEIKVRRQGDAAVTNFRLTIKSQYEGQAINRQYRITNVWMKREGHWQIAACQTASIE